MPVDPSYWLFIWLPEDVAALPLNQMLLQARSIWARQPQNKFWGPFGDVIGYELCPAPGVVYRLDLHIGLLSDGGEQKESR
ncbi:MAG: hypothetical protein ABIR71_07820 [Chthoniobacterales bacterium]